MEITGETLSAAVAAFLKGVDDGIRDPDGAFAICGALFGRPGDNAGVQRGAECIA